MPVVKSYLSQRDFKTSFLSCEKDTETIWKKLFISSKPYSDRLKRLLIIDKPDCLDSTQQQYTQLINQYDLKKMMEEDYITTVPRFDFIDHEVFKSFILLEFDDFIPTSNNWYRDCTISFTIISPLEHWELDDYKLRPHQIAGYIDGILNDTKLSGIGTLQFMGASQVVLDETYGGIVLRYVATHGIDDKEQIEE